MSRYDYAVFQQDVVLFNKCCGKKLPSEKSTFEECKQLLESQANLLIEEFSETLKALSEDNAVEMLDGIADVKFVMVWYDEILKNIPKRFLKHNYFNNVKRLVNMVSSVKLVEDFFEPSYVQVACWRVAQNNLAKFTTDKPTAEVWNSGAGSIYILSEVEVDGVSYYCLKDGHGKVRKWSGFPKVDLSDLVL